MNVNTQAFLSTHDQNSGNKKNILTLEILILKSKENQKIGRLISEFSVDFVPLVIVNFVRINSSFFIIPQTLGHVYLSL